MTYVMEKTLKCLITYHLAKSGILPNSNDAVVYAYNIAARMYTLLSADEQKTVLAQFCQNVCQRPTETKGEARLPCIRGDVFGTVYHNTCEKLCPKSR